MNILTVSGPKACEPFLVGDSPCLAHHGADALYFGYAYMSENIELPEKIFLGIEKNLHIAEKDVTRRMTPGQIGTCVDRTDNLNKQDGEEYWEESPLVVDRLQGLSCVSIRKIL